MLSLLDLLQRTRERRKTGRLFNFRFLTNAVFLRIVNHHTVKKKKKRFGVLSLKEGKRLPPQSNSDSKLTYS